MRLYYCPECGSEQLLSKEQLAKENPYKLKETIINMRDGYGRPITHYQCNCGNYLAGSIDVTGWDENGIKYAKHIIKDYNKGGIFYTEDIKERAEKFYKKWYEI